MKGLRYPILLLALAGSLCVQVAAQSKSLTVERRGDILRMTGPRLHFLEGKALEKLHDGATVIYLITATAFEAHTKKTVFLLQERFSISFDLWEEKYSVAQLRQDGRTVSRLTAAMTEAWCLDNMPVPVRTIPDGQRFMIRLECSVDESYSGNKGKSGSGLTLEGLIDLLSRKKNEAPLYWEATSDLLLLSDLKNNKQAR